MTFAMGPMRAPRGGYLFEPLQGAISTMLIGALQRGAAFVLAGQLCE